jgi:hypothetical protein
VGGEGGGEGGNIALISQGQAPGQVKFFLFFKWTWEWVCDNFNEILSPGGTLLRLPAQTFEKWKEDRKMAEQAPVGSIIAEKPVCRHCMTMVEEVSMFRGFSDPIYPKDAKEKELICSRCGKKIE